jgi:hypothetical protein
VERLTEQLVTLGTTCKGSGSQVKITAEDAAGELLGEWEKGGKQLLGSHCYPLMARWATPGLSMGPLFHTYWVQAWSTCWESSN